jgi:hypothetical protein
LEAAMTRTVTRLSTLAVLLLAAVGVLGAKCIENDALRRDSTGDWHIFGEIHNETQVQGAEIVVLGTLLDAAGNTIATAQTPICPFELSPGSFSGYDIHFQNSQALQPASHRVNVIGGKALPGPLPMLEATVTDLEARRDAQVDELVHITGKVRALMPISGDFSGCAAFYNAAGKVVSHWTIFGFGPLPSGSAQDLEFSLGFVPDEATSVRFWLVGPGSEPLRSNYQAVLSAPFPIEDAGPGPSY